MIKSNDLKIGNFIQSYHGNVMVKQISENSFITTPNLIGATHGGIYSHIDLTKDFLIKNGYEYNGSYFSNEEYGIDMRGMKFLIKGKYLCSCKYVNTLQNIIYLLTSVEMKVVW